MVDSKIYNLKSEILLTLTWRRAPGFSGLDKHGLICVFYHQTSPGKMSHTYRIDFEEWLAYCSLSFVERNYAKAQNTSY